MFDPATHKNQHYVPVFWQKRFADSAGVLYRLSGSTVGRAAAKKQMSGDWIYTRFDTRGIASNALELACGQIETQAAQAFAALDAPGALGSIEQQVFVRWFIAFSACRHPDTMSLAHRRAKDWAYLLADVHGLALSEFCESAKNFGLSFLEAAKVYAELRAVSEADLLAEAEKIEHMPPTDPALPQQLSLDPQAIERIFFKLVKQSITVVDAPRGEAFILGDTPLPPDLAQGFIVPLGATSALLWQPDKSESLPTWNRRHATAAEIELSNQAQADNALNTVVGPSETILRRYI